MEVEKQKHCIIKAKEALVPNKEYTFSSKIQQSLKKLINNEGFVTYDLNKRVFSPNGENFLGMICAVNIKGKTVTGDEKEIDIILKIITPGEQTTFLSLSDVYIRELFMYNELANIFKELQDEFNVPVQERFKTVKSYNESIPEVIILENMSRKGFKTYFRMDVVSLNFAELAVRELARFHGLSFVLKIKRPTYFEERIKKIKHPFTFNEEWHKFVGNLAGTTLNYLNGEIKKKLEKFMVNYMEKYTMYLEDDDFKFCLCHGDYRPNNIMMRENNGQICEVIPIDYQIIYYGCPVLDFVYFIFSATDQKFRRAHLSYLKDLYHDTLKGFLDFFDINVDTVFSREQFEIMYAARLDYGLLISLLVIPILMASEDEVPELISESIGDISFNTDDKCKDRMLEIINDFIEWGYL